MGIRRRKAMLENYVELWTEKCKVTQRTMETKGELGALGGTVEYARLETLRDMWKLETAEKFPRITFLGLKRKKREISTSWSRASGIIVPRRTETHHK